MAESQNIEYKTIWKDEYLKWICGLANAQGGNIFIGKDDNGNVVGVNNAKKTFGRFAKQDNYSFRHCCRSESARNGTRRLH